MLDAINQEYIKTARAKGLKNNKIIFKHALRNALIPVITYLGPQIAFTLCGGLVVETVFSIPGLGRYFVQAIHAPVEHVVRFGRFGCGFPAGGFDLRLRTLAYDDWLQYADFLDGFG